jgi:hypothetical protein
MLKVTKSLRQYTEDQLAQLLMRGLVYEVDGWLLPSISGEAAAVTYRLSGGSGNTDPAASLGGVMSTSTAAGSNLFDDVTGDESAAGDTEYRGVYVLNTGDVDLQSAFLWIQTNTPDTDTTMALALAAEGANATMATIANENTTPATVSFTTPTTKGAGLSLGTLTAGQRYGFWIRRTVTAGAAAYNNDTATFRVEGDTAA